MEILGKAIVHYVNKEVIIASAGRTIFKSTNGGKTWDEFLVIPVSLSTRIKISTRLGRRLFRQYVYHIIPVDKYITVFGFSSIFIFDAKTKQLISTNVIVGSRPLVVTHYKGDIYYGEYTSNVERHPIRIFRSTSDKKSFEEFYRFDDIRHVHSIQHDPFSDKLFVATGDEDIECMIGYFEEKSLVPIAQGSQQVRCIQLLFTEDYIYYATDAPDEKNHIYRKHRTESKPEKLQEIGGPVFYGFQTDGMMFFSTVCEPSAINNQEEVELWASLNGEDWKCVCTFQKDRYHMKLFQYGQLMFPGGEGDGENLWLTPFTTNHDQEILKIKLEDIKARF